MLIIIGFNVLLLLLGFGIARQILPMKPFLNVILFVHRTVGISMPLAVGGPIGLACMDHLHASPCGYPIPAL